ncbi:MAG: transposase [Methanofollis sp.]|nr:transposase [Methanofollis sp.]
MKHRDSWQIAKIVFLWYGREGFAGVKGRYDSFTYPQSGFKLEGDRLHLSKIGDVRIVLHRPIEETIKTLTIRRSSTGKWCACFSVECDLIPEPQKEIVVEIDLGLESFATLSTGEKIEVANRRLNFAHQTSRKVLDRFGTIVFEDLNIIKMVL